jgi:hypothetical protein
MSWLQPQTNSSRLLQPKRLQRDVLHNSVDIAVATLDRTFRVQSGRSGGCIDLCDCRTALLGRSNGRSKYVRQVTQQNLIARAGRIPQPVAGFS